VQLNSAIFNSPPKKYCPTLLPVRILSAKSDFFHEIDKIIKKLIN